MNIGFIMPFFPFQAGCDTSFELMKICNTRGFEVLTCNCLHLPYRDSIFDAVVCIAVIHHLATEVRVLFYYSHNYHTLA